MPYWGNVEGWFSEGDAAEYRRLLEMLPDKAEVVEIGTFRGRSLASVADVIIRKQLRVTGCDTFGTVEYADKDVMAKSEKMVEAFNQMKSDFGLTSFVNTCIGKSTDLATLLRKNGGLVDLVFIDGDHSYEAVKADIEAWLPLIKTGIICGHDYGGGWIGVKQAVDEAFPSEDIHLSGELWSVQL